jgi:hypothetical protein
MQKHRDAARSVEMRPAPGAELNGYEFLVGATVQTSETGHRPCFPDLATSRTVQLRVLLDAMHARSITEQRQSHPDYGGGRQTDRGDCNRNIQPRN